MNRKRIKGYETIGYSIQREDRDSNQRPKEFKYVQREGL
jgi:hypothetical protein